jgi:hypothetical protein
MHLRVPLELECRIAWGYQRQRCTITEFSVRGLTVRDSEAPVGTPVSIELPLPQGSFTLCGVVVHRVGAGGASGVRLLELPSAQQVDLELYLWGLLAESALPDPKACSIAGCGRPRKARGLCSLHYNRQRRAGREAD